MFIDIPDLKNKKEPERSTILESFLRELIKKHNREIEELKKEIEEIKRNGNK